MMLVAGRHGPRPWRAAALVSLVCGAALVGCGDTVGASDDSFDVAFDFSNDYQGWVAAFVDYPWARKPSGRLGCAGIGGAPGESVVLKVGATPLEPLRIVDAAQYYRANFDHGSQLAGGRDALPVGNIATSNANCAVPRYELKSFDSAPVPVATSASGRLWFVVGVDSGFEGTTAVYITSVRVAIGPA